MTPQDQAEFGRYVRRWERLHVNLPVRILVQTPDCLRIFNGRGTELNEGGIAVYAGVELAVGERVGIELPAPDSGPSLRLIAAVRNRIGYRYGFRFEPPPGADVVPATGQ